VALAWQRTSSTSGNPVGDPGGRPAPSKLAARLPGTGQAVVSTHQPTSGLTQRPTPAAHRVPAEAAREESATATAFRALQPRYCSIKPHYMEDGAFQVRPNHHRDPGHPRAVRIRAPRVTIGDRACISAQARRDRHRRVMAKKSRRSGVK
jgi:hypothetical protein